MTASASTPPLVLETERLVLRPRTLADTDNCLAMDSDPAVTRFVSGPWTEPSAHRAFIQKRTSGPWPPGMGYWTILLRDSGETFVGWVLLIPLNALGPEIEIGWRIRRQFWGKGLATEAARPILFHAFEVLRLPEVVAEIHPDNLGSLRVAEKIGMKRRGIVQQHDGTRATRCSLTLSEASKALVMLRSTSRQPAGEGSR